MSYRASQASLCGTGQYPKEQKDVNTDKNASSKMLCTSHFTICFNWVHLKCSLLSFSRFRALGQLSLLELPSLMRSCFFWRSHIYQHCDFLLGLVQLVYLHCSIWPLWLPSANAALAPHPHLQTSYLFSAHFVSSPSAPSPPSHDPGCFTLPPASSYLP